MDAPATYVKRPVTVEAIRWTGENAGAVKKFVGNYLSTSAFVVYPDGEPLLYVAANDAWVRIETGEWVLKDEHGCYPCKGDVFQETYSPANADRQKSEAVMTDAQPQSKREPEEVYLETIEGHCVVGEPWEDFKPGGRTTWTVKDGERVEAPVDEALVISSQTTRRNRVPKVLPFGEEAPAEEEFLHRPVLDLDVPARMYPSTTPGHSHLYLDVDMTWDQYGKVLAALADAGVIEEGYVRAALQRKATFVRLPWVAKKKDEG